MTGMQTAHHASIRSALVKKSHAWNSDVRFKAADVHSVCLLTKWLRRAGFRPCSLSSLCVLYNLVLGFEKNLRVV